MQKNESFRGFLKKAEIDPESILAINIKTGDQYVLAFNSHVVSQKMAQQVVDFMRERFGAKAFCVGVSGDPHEAIEVYRIESEPGMVTQ